MTEVERIVDQAQRAFEGDAWHGPSLMAILEGVTATQHLGARLSYCSLGKSRRKKTRR